MHNSIKILAALCVMQTALVFIVWFKPQDTQRDADSLIKVNLEKIAYAKIIDNERAVMLSSGNENWSESVTVDSNYLGDQKKISGFISQILQLKPQWALTQTIEAVKRFELSESNFQKKVELYNKNDELLETLFTGTSPEFGKVHARISENNYVFAVDLANHELSTDADDWIDKDQLAAKNSPIKVHVNQTGGTEDLRLVKIAESGWEVNGKLADQQKVKDYLSHFENLRILGISNPVEDGQGKVASITFTDDENEIIFKFYKSVNDEFSITKSTQNGTYRVAEHRVNQLLIDDSDLLVPQKDLDSPQKNESK